MKEKSVGVTKLSQISGGNHDKGSSLNAGSVTHQPSMIPTKLADSESRIEMVNFRRMMIFNRDHCKNLIKAKRQEVKELIRTDQKYNNDEYRLKQSK